MIKSKFYFEDNVYLFSKIFFIIAIALTLPFFPLLSFIFCFIYLLFLYNSDDLLLNVTVFLISIFNFLVINNSRGFVEELQLDLGIYYDVFLDIQRYGLSQVEILFGGGWEVGWPIIFDILSFFHLSPYDIVFINNFLAMSLCLAWLYCYGFKYIDKSYKGVLFASFILFFSIATTSFLQRQALSTGILLFAVSNIKQPKKYILIVLLASFFHLSAILIGGLYYLFSKIKVNFRNFLLFFFGVLFFRLFFYFIIKILVSIPALSFLAIKFGYYADVEFQIASLRFPIIIFPLLVYLFYRNPFNDEILRRVVFYSCCSYYVLLGIPLLSERINFLILMMYGFYVFMCFKKDIRFYYVLIILYFIYFILDKGWLANGIYSYWVRYDFLNLTPFYYLGY
ncbi:EpsG family protein [Acinetobacter ursingii]|uniref:EpsG family protein n=1 Tax=Acinetobacter ursingii TaxID=108980 RepID=UPI00300B2973